MLNSLLSAKYSSSLLNRNIESSGAYPVYIILLVQIIILSLAMLIDTLLITPTHIPLLSCVVSVGYFCFILYPKTHWRLIAFPFLLFHFIANQPVINNFLHSLYLSIFTLIIIIFLAHLTHKLLRGKESFSLPFIHVVVGFGVLLSLSYQLVYIATVMNPPIFAAISDEWAFFSMGQLVGFIISFSILMMILMSQNQYAYGMKLLTIESYISLIIITILTILTLFYGGELVHYLSIYLVIPVVWFCYRYRWWGMSSFTIVINFFTIMFAISNSHFFNIDTNISYDDLIWFLLALNLFSLYINAMVFELDEIKRVNRKNQVLMTARNADLIEVNTQIKELNRHLISAQEKQRQQLSRQLEKLMGENINALQQSITVLEMRASFSQKENNPYYAIKKFTNIIYLSVYELVNWLRPETLERLGLINTLNSKLFKDALALNNIRYEFELIGEHAEIADEIALPLFRVIQESVSNAIKHSKANTFTVKCQFNDSHLQLWIEDDGNGFDSDNVKRGFGLSSMKSRIEAINGEFSMTSTNGVSIYINTPL